MSNPVLTQFLLNHGFTGFDMEVVPDNPVSVIQFLPEPEPKSIRAPRKSSRSPRRNVRVPRKNRSQRRSSSSKPRRPESSNLLLEEPPLRRMNATCPATRRKKVGHVPKKKEPRRDRRSTRDSACNRTRSHRSSSKVSPSSSPRKFVHTGSLESSQSTAITLNVPKTVWATTA